MRLREPSDDLVTKTFGPIVVLVLAGGPMGGWGDVSVGVTVLGWAGIVLLVAGLMRLWRIGVYVSSDGIEIVNPRHSASFAWEEIDRFEIGFPEARFWKWSPVAVLGQGPRIPMVAIQSPQPWTRPSNDFAERAVAKLDQMLSVSRLHNGSVPGEELIFDGKFRRDLNVDTDTQQSGSN